MTVVLCSASIKTVENYPSTLTPTRKRNIKADTEA